MLCAHYHLAPCDAHKIVSTLQSDHQPCTPSLQHGRSGCAGLTYGIDDGRAQALGAQHCFLQVPERLDVVLGRAPLQRSTRGCHTQLHDSSHAVDRHQHKVNVTWQLHTVRSTRAALMPALIIASRVSTLRHAGPSVQMTAGNGRHHTHQRQCAYTPSYCGGSHQQHGGTERYCRSAVRSPRSGGR